jgi:hypothetical protein
MEGHDGHNIQYRSRRSRRRNVAVARFLYAMISEVKLAEPRGSNRSNGSSHEKLLLLMDAGQGSFVTGKSIDKRPSQLLGDF